MTTLPPLADRQAINIDTHERALVYSALLLRKANQTLTDTKYKNAVRVTTAETQDTTTLAITAKIVIEAKIPYSSQGALSSGGNFVKNILSFSPVNPYPVAIDILPSNNTTLGGDPEWVTTLEKYFAFHAFKYQQALVTNNQANILNTAKIQFFEEDTTEPSIKITVSIPIDFNTYLITNSLLASVTIPGLTAFSPESPLIKQEPYQLYSDELTVIPSITNSLHGINLIVNLADDTNLSLPDNSSITENITFNIRFKSTSTGILTLLSSGNSVIDSSLNRCASGTLNISFAKNIGVGGTWFLAGNLI